MQSRGKSRYVKKKKINKNMHVHVAFERTLLKWWVSTHGTQDM